jgi:hypothetical protein
MNEPKTEQLSRCAHQGIAGDRQSREQETRQERPAPPQPIEERSSDQVRSQIRHRVGGDDQPDECRARAERRCIRSSDRILDEEIEESSEDEQANHPEKRALRGARPTDEPLSHTRSFPSLIIRERHGLSRSRTAVQRKMILIRQTRVNTFAQFTTGQSLDMIGTAG